MITVTELRKRLEQFEASGNGNNPVILRATKKTPDARHSTNYRLDSAIFGVSYACGGSLQIDGVDYTELGSTPDSLIKDWE